MDHSQLNLQTQVSLLKQAVEQAKKPNSGSIISKFYAYKRNA